MEDSAHDYATLLATIATLRRQLSLTPLDDPQRDLLYYKLLWCYQEAHTVLQHRIVTQLAHLRASGSDPPND